MGTWVHVLVAAPDPDDLICRARDRIAELEARWSRFRPASEVSRANGRRTTRVQVSADTVRLVRLAAVAAEELAPYFDPCQLDDLTAWGYDRSFSLLGTVTAAPAPSATALPARPARQVLEYGEDWVCFPASGFDPGAIGKGLAADLVAEELIAAGATGVMVNLGGDLRCLGVPPVELSAEAWTVDLTDEHEHVQQTLRLGEGAVATSSSRRRTWVTVAGPAHHLLDPRDRAPVAAPARSVTVLSDRGWRSEVVATAVLVAGVEAGRALVERTASSALVIDAEGVHHHLGPLHRYLSVGAPVKESVG
jgi:FAD:protein FMN transferase